MQMNFRQWILSHREFFVDWVVRLEGSPSDNVMTVYLAAVLFGKEFPDHEQDVLDMFEAIDLGPAGIEAIRKAIEEYTLYLSDFNEHEAGMDFEDTRALGGSQAFTGVAPFGSHPLDEGPSHKDGPGYSPEESWSD